MRSYTIRLSVALATFLVGVAAANFLNFPQLDSLLYGDSEREVLKVEQEYIRAHTERDVAALDRVLADDFTSFGGKVRKSHRLALLANPYFKVASFTTDDVSVRVRGWKASVTGTERIRGSFRGREFDIPPFRFTRRFERRGGRWLIVSSEYSIP